MKYTVSIDLAVGLDEFIRLFDDYENRYKWQRGLLSITPVSGQPSQLGAQTKMLFRSGKGKIEITETITVRNLPSEFSCTYDAPGVHNLVQHRFAPISSNGVRWESENEFKFTTLTMKAIGVSMRSAFPKQSMQYLSDFKAFAEQGIDVRDQAA
jgi:hypothetical protein